ncbi:ceramide kinase-like isoform X1 [Pyrus x bretschneideri]|uniref:ceramide kinase-like isoform X1 n=1 Tax=Pyrus x bretschneideri TaxID=225117 RepID=UPI00202E9C1B|nr:ceramide kinase-like isoform X1 [Pyrus x bretschneideri]
MCHGVPGTWKNLSFCSTTPCSYPGETKWSISKGNFISIGAAVISNRNERAPDGLVADAHLSDGFMRLNIEQRLLSCSPSMVLTNQFKLCTGLSTVEAENVDEVVIVDADMIIRKQIVP